MPAECNHSYKYHETALGAFCKGNPERWYPLMAVGCGSFLVLVVVGAIVGLRALFF